MTNQKSPIRAKPNMKGTDNHGSTSSTDPGHNSSTSSGGPEVTTNIKSISPSRRANGSKKTPPTQSHNVANTPPVFLECRNDLQFELYTVDEDDRSKVSMDYGVIVLSDEGDEEEYEPFIKTEPQEEDDEKKSEENGYEENLSDGKSDEERLGEKSGEETSDSDNSDEGIYNIGNSDKEISDIDDSDDEKSDKKSIDCEKIGHQNKKSFKTPVKEVTLTDVMGSLKELHSKVDILGWNVTRVSNATVPGEKVVKRPPGLPSVPLETLKDLSQMESFLADDSNLNAAGNYLAKFVTSGNLSKSVNTLLKKTIGKIVAKQYTFHGTGSKKKFEGLYIWNAITCALTTAFKSSELLGADALASRWLTLKGYDRKQ